MLGKCVKKKRNKDANFELGSLLSGVVKDPIEICQPQITLWLRQEKVPLDQDAVDIGCGACLDAAACYKVWHVSMLSIPTGTFGNCSMLTCWAMTLISDISRPNYLVPWAIPRSFGWMFVRPWSYVPLPNLARKQLGLGPGRRWSFVDPLTRVRRWDLRLDTNCRYLATSLLLADNNDMVRMIVNSVKTDMASGNEAETKLSRICPPKILKEERRKSRVALVWTIEHCFKCRSTTVLEQI